MKRGLKAETKSSPYTKKCDYLISVIEHRRRRLINDDTKIAIKRQAQPCGGAGYVFPKTAN